MLNGDELNRLLEKIPLILFNMVEQLSLRMDEREHMLREMCHRDVPSRVASFYCATRNTDNMIMYSSQKDMASLLGTKREFVGRKLSEFQRAGHIKVNKNQNTVKNYEALVNVANKN